MARRFKEIVRKPKNTVQQVKWSEVREEILSVNPELAAALDTVPNKEDRHLFKVTYSFGDTILKNGVFHLPTDLDLVLPIQDRRVDSDLREHLDYNHNTLPAGVILKNTTELFLKSEDRIIPFTLMKPGKIFALWPLLDPVLTFHACDTWNMVAGSRSLFMLPKITSSFGFERLSRIRGVRLALPNSLLEHGEVMRDIVQHESFEETWQCEILFFGKAWFEESRNNWLDFSNFLYKEAWKDSNYWRNKHLFDFSWDLFVKSLNKKRVKVNSSVVDIVKHILMLSLGIIPGFTPALSNEVGPIEGLQKEFYRIYGLRKFAATIMVPHHFSLKDKGPSIYWSLQLENYFESCPRAKNLRTILSTLQDVKKLLERFREAVDEKQMQGVPGTPLEDIIKNVSYGFFHSEPDPYKIIQPASLMPKEDKTLIHCLTKSSPADRGFSDVSPFVRGCIRISSS